MKVYIKRHLNIHPFRIYAPFVRRASKRRHFWCGYVNDGKDKRMHRCCKRSMKNFMQQELKKEIENYE